MAARYVPHGTLHARLRLAGTLSALATLLALYASFLRVCGLVGLAASAAVLFAAYASWQRSAWAAANARRVPRAHPHSPSHRAAPRPVPLEAALAAAHAAARDVEPALAAACTLDASDARSPAAAALARLAAREAAKAHLAARDRPITGLRPGERLGAAVSAAAGAAAAAGRLPSAALQRSGARAAAAARAVMELRRAPAVIDADTRAASLGMSHVALPWRDYLWASLAILPNLSANWVFGTARLLLRQALAHAGLRAPAPVRHAALVGRLLLESMQCTRFACVNDAGNALFVWRGIGLLDARGEATEARLLTIEVSLQTREFVRGALDGRELTASEAGIIVWFDTIGGSHVLVHSLANWALRIDHEHPLIARASVCTVAFNSCVAAAAARARVRGRVRSLTLPPSTPSLLPQLWL
jgi:hypothetical protein